MRGEQRVVAEVATSDKTSVERCETGTHGSSSAAVRGPLRDAHAGERHSRRCRGAGPVCRRSVHPRAQGSFGPFPAASQPGKAHRGTLPRKQLGASRLRAGPDRGAQFAGREAAISLENARLYRDLAEREARIRRLVDANIIGIFMWDTRASSWMPTTRSCGWSDTTVRTWPRASNWTDLTPARMARAMTSRRRRC